MSTTNVKELSSVHVGNGGILKRIQHASSSTNTTMTFGLFLPSSYVANHNDILPKEKTTPALFWLSGLTCDDTNFEMKAGPKAFEAAEKAGLAIVIPDTSPRGENVPNTDSYDLGQGAGFYINATKEPYSQHYQMLTYITKELPSLVLDYYNVGGAYKSISGHSMGGHGALTIALNNPKDWISVSAFSPICSPSNCPWGKKAFESYLGGVEAGLPYDATAILQNRTTSIPEYDDILIEQGSSDQFLEEQLKPQLFMKAASKIRQKVTLNMRPNFDHSYYFIAAFIESHIQFHAKKLKEKKQEEDASDLSYDFSATQNKPIKCKAMVARAPKQPLTLETITVLPPKSFEVRVKVIANALCHTDVYTLDGQDPEGLFPCILGHEAGCIVESIGKGVRSVSVGDHVIPCYTPQCSESNCIFCQSPKTNLCPKIRSTQGQGVMPDGTVRFKDTEGNGIYHFMGCSTMSEYTVLAEISCAKIHKKAALDKVCLFGCGVSTGLGAVWNTCEVEPNSSVAVFGLGAVGLAVIQGAKHAGASTIIGVDINPDKFHIAKDLGATICVNPNTDVPEGKTIQSYIAGTVTQWGVDYSFDCTGNTNVMRSALECAHRGWGTSCVIGVAASGHTIETRPFQLVTGRVWKGTAFGGFKSRKDVPILVERNLKGELEIDHFITHRMKGVEKTNEAIEALHGGECLRAVVRY